MQTTGLLFPGKHKLKTVQHSDTTEPQRVFVEKGGYAISYNSDGTSLVGDAVLSGAKIDWAPLFSFFINQVLDGQWGEVADIWLGMEYGAASVTRFSQLVEKVNMFF